MHYQSRSIGTKYTNHLSRHTRLHIPLNQELSSNYATTFYDIDASINENRNTSPTQIQFERAKLLGNRY